MEQGRGKREEGRDARADNIGHLARCFLVKRTRESLALDLATAFYTVIDLDIEVLALREREALRRNQADEFSRMVTDRQYTGPGITAVRLWNKRRRENAQKIAFTRSAAG